MIKCFFFNSIYDIIWKESRTFFSVSKQSKEIRSNFRAFKKKNGPHPTEHNTKTKRFAYYAIAPVFHRQFVFFSFISVCSNLADHVQIKTRPSNYKRKVASSSKYV